MTKKDSYLSTIRKYWINTPELFSEKYQTNVFQLLLPVNAFLLSRRKKVHNIVNKNLKGKKVLDVGCGSGIFMLDFINKGAKVSGVDYSQKMLNIAQSQLKENSVPKNQYRLIKASATKLPLKDKEFDLILATGLTDYMTDEENRKFLAEAARVLKKDGMIIVSFPVDKSPFAFVRSGFGLKVRQKFFKLPPIHNEFSKEKIQKFLKEVDLKITGSTKVFSTMWIITAKFKK